MCREGIQGSWAGNPTAVVVAFAIALVAWGSSNTLLLARPGDLDGDGDVTLLDQRLFVGCLGGPGSPPVSNDCAAADHDFDLDVDLRDAARFQNAFGLQVGCDPRWMGGFEFGGMNGTVESLVVFDDGTGPALYAGGSFLTADGITVRGVAKWNGQTWAPLGEGMTRTVKALAVFDDGSGAALYAGGYFTIADEVERIARWNGKSWSPVGTGIGRSLSDFVSALTVFDDGSGAALYAGGWFTVAGGKEVDGIAKWDGMQWSPVGPLGQSRTQLEVLGVFDDGGGPALYAGGDFREIGGVDANSIAKWNGEAWTPLGDGTWGTVYALQEHDDGSGPALFVGGWFYQLGNGMIVMGVAKWDGHSWHALGNGVRDDGAISFAVFDDGTGTALYAGRKAHDVLRPYGPTRNSVERWDGIAWSPVGGPIDGGFINALAVFDDGSGTALYAGGDFARVGGMPGITANRVAKWNGSAWSPLGEDRGTNRAVTALATFDDGFGNALYAGGIFTNAGGREARYIAKWRIGEGWSPLGDGMNGTVNALTVFDDSTGAGLYAGGDFTIAGDVSAKGIAKWNGTLWEAIPHELDVADFRALAVFDDGAGPALYLGGGFRPANGAEGPYPVAKWDGASWSSVGGLSGGVYAMTVWDDGSGPALYVGGNLLDLTDASRKSVAQWNGDTWSFLGGDIGGPVEALAVFNDGSGEALYAGGYLFRNGIRGVAKWNGTSWSTLGVGLNFTVYALTVFDDGAGPALYAGGGFYGSPANYFARWDGNAWSDPGNGMDGPVSALAVFNSALVVGGFFTLAGNQSSGNIAMWASPVLPCD